MRFSGRQKRIILRILVAAAVILFCVITIFEIVKINHKNAELKIRLERLEEKISEEQARRLDLENEEVYVKTRKYIEEKAKSIGYVYPDEIIFREDD